MSDSQQFVDASAAIATSKAATYAGSGAAGISAWMGSIDLGFWVSIGIAIAGFVMNWYFAKKKIYEMKLNTMLMVITLKI